jgi:quercetin dioxygenase-like cupin family protein
MTGTQEGRGLLPVGRAEPLADLLQLQPHGIVSRVIARSGGGNVTLFAIDEGEGLSEHTTPYDALAIVLEGRLRIQIADAVVTASAGQVVKMPANVPHALQAEQPSRMMLVMLK